MRELSSPAASTSNSTPQRLNSSATMSQHSEDSSLLKNVDCGTPEQSYSSTLEREFEVHDIGNLVEVGDLEPAFSFRKLLRFAGPGFAM
ncbi:hypothetical protein H4S00_006785 [Coemansia sp. D1744]|nr:hypothetical protein H4S00_006785 [Coemansia sp. D1744]